MAGPRTTVGLGKLAQNGLPGTLSSEIDQRVRIRKRETSSV